MRLSDLQKKFLAALLSGEAEQLAAEVVPEVNLSIYRDNVFTAMEKALALTYPCIAKLVGEKFFSQVTGAFAKDHPPAEGNLDAFGAGFPAFLEAHAPAASVPYLPDMARLEWLMHEASLAGKGNVIDVSALAAIPPEKYFSLKLHLHPSVRLMESRFPLDRIRAFCERDGQGERLDIAEEGSARLLVVRPWRNVEVHALHAADHAFLRAVAAGAAMEEAFGSAAAQDETFDLSAFIHLQLGYGTFGGFSLGL